MTIIIIVADVERMTTVRLMWMYVMQIKGVNEEGGIYEVWF